MDSLGTAPIEGDYVETVEGLIFTVKGLFHPAGRVVAYLRYMPDPKGERTRGDGRYKRMYDADETTRLLERRYPQYVGYVAALGLTLQSVPTDRIIRVYRPGEMLRALMSEAKTDLEKTTVRFASALSSESGVPVDRFGVSGSALLGLASPTSDVDLIVYGSEAGKRVYEALKRLRETSGWISPYDERTIKGVLKSRWGDTGLDLEKLRDIEIRKVLHGMVSGRDYFVRLVKMPEEAEEAIGFKPICKTRLRTVITSAEDSIFTPCTYQVKDCVILDADYPKAVCELVSFRGKFTEQARGGETIEARGTLEEVAYNDRTLCRLVLGGSGDYLIPTEILE